MHSKKIISLAIFLNLIGIRTWAVPLFGESEGTIKEGILTLYKDHADPKKVYFFPNSTKFSKDNSGVPLFNFVFWGISNPTPETPPGAYLTMATHLASDPDQQKALDNYIAAHPDMQVAVLPIKSSTVGLKSTSPGDLPLKALFSEFNFSKVGGRAEDEIGINAVLTPVGARAFKGLLKPEVGGQKLKIDYCYITQGFGPNMDATVSVDMRRVYDYFEANHSGGWGFWGWHIKAIVEKLNDGRTIRIEKNGGDAKDWEILNTVTADIVNRLFKPELTASPVSAASGNSWFSINASVVHKEELKSEVWRYLRRDLEDREYCTAISIKDLAPYLSTIVVDADK